MSADKWSICPRCLGRAKAEHKAVKATIDDSSRAGVSEAVLQAARAGLKLPDPYDYSTFREEYEFYGTENGVVRVSFSGHCTECDLGLDFDDEHPIPGLGDESPGERPAGGD